MKHRLILAAILTLIRASPAVAGDIPMSARATTAPVPFFAWQENTIAYRYEFTASNPGAGETPKHVATFSHFDVWAYGTNFLNVDWLKATNGSPPPFGTPAAPCDLSHALNCEGFTEIYAFVRSTLGWNQLSGTTVFSIGPLTNIEFLVGADLNTDNTTFASAKRAIEAGIQFDFSTPYKGFLNVAVVAYKEWQHDGFAALGTINPSGKVDFNTTWAVEANYVQPLGFLPSTIPLTFKSMLTIRGPKGNGEPGNPSVGLNRTIEYYSQHTLYFDVGQVAGQKPGMLSVFAGYRFWKNKFGIDSNQREGRFPFTTENTWLTGVQMTF